MRYAGGVEGMREKNTHTGFWEGNVKENAHLVDVGVGGKIILK
jgi:hypothetical protein